MNTFRVQYRITCYDGEDIREKLRWICLEQSVELPEDVVPVDILDKVVGQVQDWSEINERAYHAKIDWPLDNIGDDPTQFLNILYGNISLKRGIKIVSVDWDSLIPILEGPAFGIDAIRTRIGVSERAMACGVLKPMGLSAEGLAEQALAFSSGGIDLIKDDHGLANQKYASFEERLAKVVKAVDQGNEDSANKTLYFPNITTSGTKLLDRFKQAADLGADGVMVIPELCGYESMHVLARSDIELPIIAHPAFSGSRVTDPDHGFTPAFLYGEIYRAFGADFAVYPNTGGRFSFSEEECKGLNHQARSSDSPFKKVFPTPGGGMKRETLTKWVKEYGNDTVFLLGASMLQHPGGLKKAASEVHALLEATIS